MKKRITLLVFLCLALVLTMAGLATAAKTTEIRVWAFSWTASTLDKIKTMFEAENPGITVKVELQDWAGMQTLALAAIASGKDVPDVCTFSSAWVGPMMTSKGLADISKYIDSKTKSKFIDGALGIYSYKGVQYGLPLDIDVATIIYRKDIVDPALRKLGMKEFPKDWESFVKLLQEVSADTNRDGQIDQYGLLFEEGVYYLQAAMLYQRGGRYFDAKYTKAYFNSKESVEALSDLVYLHKNKLALLWPSSNGDVMPALKSGRAVMYIQGPWYRGPMKENMPELKGQWMFAPMPVKKKGAPFTALTGLGLCVPYNAPHLAEAVKFMKFFCTDEDAQRAYFADAGSPSPLKTLLADPMYNAVDPYFGASIYPPVVQAMKNGFGLEIFPKQEMNDALKDAMQKALYDNISPQRALDEAQKKASSLF